jgi:hypothetical protein
MTDSLPHDPSRIDRLLDAIDLIKLDRREEARQLLRDLIREDNDFEDGWLWMSVAVDSLDQSTICLDNVLRVNPDHVQAAGALYRLRESEMRMEQRRDRLHSLRDWSLGLFWLLFVGLIFAVLFTYPLPEVTFRTLEDFPLP